MRDIFDVLVDDYGTEKLNEDFKKKMIKRNKKNLYAILNLKKETTTFPLRQYYQRNGKKIDLLDKGIDIPPHINQAKYFLDNNNQIIIVSENYSDLGEFDLKIINNMTHFCNNKKWDMKIIQGCETHYLGRTMVVAFLTGYYV